MGNVWDARRRGEGTRSLREGPSRRNQGGDGAAGRAASLMLRAKQPWRRDRRRNASEKETVMNRFPGKRPLLLLAALAPLFLLVQSSSAEAWTKNARTQSVRPVRNEPPPQVTMNAWTVGLAGGLIEGTPIRLAAEIARVVDDGDNLHVLPVVTRGATENVNSLLY